MAKRIRKFSLVSYLNEDEIQEILTFHKSKIVGYAYIFHDKDDCVPHFHIGIKLYNARTLPDVLKWFTVGRNQNTLIEPLVYDNFLDYLTHKLDKDKAQYDESLIKSYNVDEFILLDSHDDSYEILDKLISGYSVRELCKQYGRDFIYHYSSYLALANIIKEEEGTL